MAPKSNASDETTLLLKQLLAIELWRGGLSQQQIRKRLGISNNAVNAMLKGVSRSIRTFTADAE